jgi:TolB-like protein/Flp pilus assembly protein TadD
MPAVAAAAPMPNSDKPSIAVLPFTNMSGDPEQEYFSDGITEDIITELSRFRSLLVIARNSSFQYKGKSVDVRRVARELRVQYVVEGSVRKMANRIRITAQFIDTSTGSHLWSERYDRALDDLFAVQDEVVRTVAATLVGRLEQAAWERVKTRPTTDLRAYELYLRGLKHFVAWTPLDNRASRTLFTAAIDIERDYAAAHAALSEAVFRDWLNGWSDNPEADFTAFHELAIRSVQLDEEDSRTHAALGLACIYHGQWDRARLHLMRAVELNPSNTHALVCLARLELLTGNSQGAIERVQGATRLNPFGKYGWYLGQAYYVAGRYDDATAILRSLSEPTAMVWAWLAASQAMLGQDRAAGASLRAFHEAMKNSPLGQQLADGQGWRRFLLERWPFQKDGDLQNLLQGLRKAGLPE